MTADTPLAFDRSAPEAGTPVEIGPGIMRLIAPNPGPFTYTGTASYVVTGPDGDVIVIDPGPNKDAHLAALDSAIAGRPVRHILVTHTHRDHVDLLSRLVERTGATTVGQRFTPRPGADGTTGLDAAHDAGFVPDITATDGLRIALGGRALTALATPGHAANHVAFALDGEGILFSGDHVMGWSTSVVAPPDGHMGDYMRSLQRLLGRGDRLYLPGHGDAVASPDRFVRGLITHRRQRENKILSRLKAGDRALPDIVAGAYPDLDPKLFGAASLSTRAHLVHLAEQDLAAEDETDVWRPA